MFSLQRLIISFLGLMFMLGASIAAQANPFTVSGVYVDAEGENAIAAQTSALSDGQRRAAQTIVQRVTFEDARGIDITAQEAARMMRAMEIADEKRTSSRYFGTITVAFNPPAVREFVESKGLTYVASQSAPRLILPLENGRDAMGSEWGDIWTSGVGANSLTPLRVITAPRRISGYVDSAALSSGKLADFESLARAENVSAIVIADARPQAGQIVVNLREIDLSRGTSETLGSVTARDYATAAGQVTSALEAGWKRRLSQDRGPSQDVVVSVLYRSLGEWQDLQRAINGSSVISGARLDALSKDGALMTLSLQGTPERLAEEMRFKGVTVKDDAKLGVVLQLAR